MKKGKQGPDKRVKLDRSEYVLTVLLSMFRDGPEAAGEVDPADMDGGPRELFAFFQDMAGFGYDLFLTERWRLILEGTNYPNDQ